MKDNFKIINKFVKDNIIFRKEENSDMDINKKKEGKKFHN